MEDVRLFTHEHFIRCTELMLYLSREVEQLNPLVILHLAGASLSQHHHLSRSLQITRGPQIACALVRWLKGKSSTRDCASTDLNGVACWKHSFILA
jgi:hypothetical protein